MYFKSHQCNKTKGTNGRDDKDRRKINDIATILDNIEKCVYDLRKS